MPLNVRVPAPVFVTLPVVAVLPLPTTPVTVVLPLPAIVRVRPVPLLERARLLKVTVPESLLVSVKLPPLLVSAPKPRSDDPTTVELAVSETALVME